MRASVLITTISLFLVGVSASKVVDLTDDNFDSIIGQGKPALVEFYAPWCGHCTKLAPTYDLLADAFAHQSDKVIIAKTDADGVGKGLGKRFGVQGFPTIKWFPANDVENPIEYSGGRDLDSLVEFVRINSKVKSNIKPPAPPATTEVTATNFDKIVRNSGKNVLVAFTAPWCGHCKNMKAAYEKVAAAFKNEDNCVVAQMNADEEANKPLASEFGVSSFPTLKFFPADGSEPIPYSGARTEEAFVEFLNEHCGTHRTAAGLLSETAGKYLPLDTLAATFFSSPLAKRPDIIAQAKSFLADLAASDAAVKANESVHYYIKAMEKIVDKGDGWLVKETARFAKLVNSPSLAPSKIDEIIIKKNILSSFVYRKLEDAASQVSEAASDATDAVKNAAGDAAQKVEQIRQEL